MSKPSFRLAIDVGGTFTDFVLVDAITGAVRFEKLLSTPADPSEGSLAGTRHVLAAAGVSGNAVGEVVHATTVATNAVLERKGARIGLIATRGFRDTLEIGRESRYDIYDLGLSVPEPLVPRNRRLEIGARTRVDGSELVALDLAELDRVLDALVKQAGVEAIAVCLLHAYAYPAHELAIARRAAERHPGVAVSISSEVAGEIREFERTSTAVVDAYVKPLVQHYVRRLADGLDSIGVRQQVSMMLSHGGVGPAREVADRFPVRMIESGPAAGAIAAAHVARGALASPQAIAFDMGGTTAKMSLVRDGEPALAAEYEVAHVHRFKRGSGYPLQIAAIELLEIGAGGGSIAHINRLGLLNVGPESAGAVPGPVCYGRGGTRATVTDADLVLGYLDPAHFLGGDMRLDPDAARAAIERELCPALAMPPEQVAWGIHNVVNERMAAATRAHAAEKGVDLRRFALIAFGGAGPVHAYALARKLGVTKVIVPFGAGVASSIGCLVAKPGVELAGAYIDRLDRFDWHTVAARYEGMRSRASAALAGLVGTQDTLVMHASMDVRCEGQGYAVTIPLPAGHPFDGDLVAPITAAFGDVYAQVYGHRPPGVPLESVALRARVELPRDVLPLAFTTQPAADAAAAVRGRRPVWFEAARTFVDTPVYDRYRLPSGVQIPGPAIVEERETTTVVGPACVFGHDRQLNLVIDLVPGDRSDA